MNIMDGPTQMLGVSVHYARGEIDWNQVMEHVCVCMGRLIEKRMTIDCELKWKLAVNCCVVYMV